MLRLVPKPSCARARRTARRSRPTRSWPRRTTGWASTYLLDDTGSEEARVSLEAAAYLLPLETDIGLALGKILAGRGSILEAIPAFEYVLRWSPSTEQRDEARAELDKLRKLGSEGAPVPASPAPAAAPAIEPSPAP